MHTRSIATAEPTIAMAKRVWSVHRCMSYQRLAATITRTAGAAATARGARSFAYSISTLRRRSRAYSA
ncbi:hypothetical protein XcmpCFBP7700_16050 [Xanthomonas campestris]|uniref:hypothetical protein n=1 Tax=Xanthomonas campestris TaxID=339 RepID=UPI000E75F631|nr:hypothetical protein [Xanthomonas campestris]RJU12511.1 hypothetical protein XcmpCFBP7700_16050 [Xanthomonas campestris]